jgi:malonyl-CoA O-methyltransferase
MLSGSKLDKQGIKFSFSKASSSYDAMASLQRTVGRELLKQQTPDSLKGTFLDIGCGTGFLTGELLTLSGDNKLIALDLARSMVETTRDKWANKNVQYLCADAELLPLANESMDAVFSNVALQWCQNLNKVLADIYRILKPNGTLIFSTFGEKTLQELKSAWSDVDNFTHVNEFYNAEDIRQFLNAANYKNIRISETIYIQKYDSVIALMRELKGIGAHNVTAGRNRTITGKSKMQKMIQAYERLKHAQRIPATFEVINVFAQI